MKVKLGFLIFFLLLLASCSSSRKITTTKTNKETITERPYESVSPVKQVQHVKKLQKSNKSLNKYSLQYIKRYAPIAVSEMHKYNVPASITLAQGILESGNGRSQLASKSNNHFGIKCKRDWKGKKVYHDDDASGECFRAYQDPKESYRDHSLFLVERERYASLFRLKKTDYKAWAKGLKKAGYATDPAYAEKLIGLIQRLSLWKYDNPKVLPDFNVKNQDIHIVQKGDTLYGLSKRYKISVDKLKKINRLTSSEIQIGQHIRVEK